MIWIDLESFSEADLGEVGAYTYAHHPSTEITLLGFAIDNTPAKVWDITRQRPVPADLHEALLNPAHKCVAHTVGFDRTMLMAKLPQYDWSLERWVDTAVLCATDGLPLDLDRSTHIVLNDDQAKVKDGKRLVQKFCKPAPRNHKAERYTRENSPEDWARFIEYCRMDVESMRAMARQLDPANYELEYEHWLINMRMNDRGIPVDRRSCELFIEQLAEAERVMTARLRELTDYKVSTIKQSVQLRDWVNAQGYSIPNVQAATIEAALSDPALPPLVRDVLSIRQSLAKSSTAKYQKMLAASAADGRLHGMLQFYGASRTGREAGRLVQPQNFKRPGMKPDAVEEVVGLLNEGKSLLPETAFEAASDCLRAMFCAPEGQLFVVADLSNIEGRVLAWLAGEEWKLQAFRDYDRGEGPDIYKLSFSKSFGKPVEDVDDDDRQIGKVQELALGFGGGVGAFHQMAAGYGVAVTDARADEIKVGWRAAHPAIVALWYQAERAWQAALNKPGTAYKIGEHCQIVYRAATDRMRLRLPSGRYLVYYKPRYETVVKPTWETESPTFWGVDSVTKQWRKIDSWGGTLVENITQAAARDVLWHGVTLAERTGFECLGTVHDEIIAEMDEDKADVALLEQCMATVPEWAPGLPLAAAGWSGRRYRK